MKLFKGQSENIRKVQKRQKTMEATLNQLSTDIWGVKGGQKAR